jgi:signal transduction histidine kinase/AraC-like DNA-binding protein
VGVLAGWQFYRPTIPFNYGVPIIRGIEKAAGEHGCNLLFACGMGVLSEENVADRPAWPTLDSEVDFVPVGPWNTDGLIVLTPLLSPTRSEYIRALRAEGHPVVFISSGEKGPTVMADNDDGIRQALQHLVGHGHRQIAFIAGSEGDATGDTGMRLRAFRKYARELGVPTDRTMIAYSQHTVGGGKVAMRRILAAGGPLTAVLASNDESAKGAMLALKEAGLSVPEDVAVVGFDNRSDTVAYRPALTTVHMPQVEIGYRALGMIMDLIEGRPVRPQTIRVPTRLVVRDSCGCKPSLEEAGAAGSRPRGGAAQSRTRQLTTAMVDAMLRDTQQFGAADVRPGCQALVEGLLRSLEEGQPAHFLDAARSVQAEIEASERDAHSWQAALSALRRALDSLEDRMDPASVCRIDLMLDQARVLFSDLSYRQLLRQHASSYVLINEMGQLVSRLFRATDETQIMEALARELPEMGIGQAGIAFYEPEAEDPVAWSVLHRIPAAGIAPRRFPSREFPFPELYPADEPFRQVVLPLVSQHDRLGFMCFDTRQLEKCGSIVQEVGFAFNHVRLYREAVEGRQQAEEAHRVKSHFLSTVSHELRTPLNLIIGMSEIVLREDENQTGGVPDGHRQNLEQIHASATHLSRLIRDVLDLASSEAGRLRLTNEFVDLGELLQGAAETGRQLAEAKGLAWSEFLPSSGPWVWGDQTRLRQVILNLIHNAVKFTASGEISLRMEVGSDLVTVSVRDTGLGIPADEQELIFREFNRSERAALQGYGGIGLGLAICKRLIELHAGEIGVHSSGQPGHGSTFYFKLPIIEPGGIELAAQRPPEPLGRTVLLLRSRTADAGFLRENLSRRGVLLQDLVMTQAPDWQHQVLMRPPDVVALDVSLPPAVGWDATHWLKGNPATRDIPILFCSLAANRGSAIDLEYMAKPVRGEDLAHALVQRGFGPEAAADGRTVLVVDDDLATLEMNSRLVQKHLEGGRVIKARNGREALEVIHAEHPDLVLLDLVMPEVDGFQVLEAMRSQPRTRSIPVIVLTGITLSERDMNRLYQGVATVLSKGVFSVDETMGHIELALERRRELNEQAQQLVRKAVAYIHQNYGEPVSREDLARHVGMSSDYLTYCFRKETGLTPITYLNRYRISKAKLLLAEGSQSITEIALAVGFSDSGYFSRLFRREAGISPESYRAAT